MRNVVFCVDSYYQLIIAINLKINRYSEDNVDVILFNTMDNADKVLNNLITSGIFKSVILAKTILNMTKTNSSFFKRIPKYFVYVYSMLMPIRYTKKVLQLNSIKFYDDFFFYGYRPIVQSIFNACKRVNNKIQCFRMDDGMGSYIREWNIPKPKLRVSIEKVMRYIAKFEGIENYIVGFYVPNIKLITYEVKYKLYEIPDYRNPILIDVLNKIFDFKREKNIINKKIVYFGIYGKENIENDIKYLKEISKYVSKDEIIIKVHPRVEKQAYTSLGVDVLDQSFIPWEIFMINYNFNSTVFISQMSSAVLSSRIIFRRIGKDVYLYNCTDKDRNKTLKEIDRFLNTYKSIENLHDNIIIPETISELKGIIKRMEL